MSDEGSKYNHPWLTRVIFSRTLRFRDIRSEFQKFFMEGSWETLIIPASNLKKTWWEPWSNRRYFLKGINICAISSVFHRILTLMHSSLDGVSDPISVYCEKVQTSLCLFLVIRVICNLADWSLSRHRECSGSDDWWWLKRALESLGARGAVAGQAGEPRTLLWYDIWYQLPKPCQCHSCLVF